MSEEMFRLFAVCPRGVEPALSGEIEQLGFSGVERRSGGVAFSGNVRDLYRANLWLRTANRVLVNLVSFDCPDAEALYEGAAAVEWERWMTARHTLAVAGDVDPRVFRDPRYGALKVKDAVCDRFRLRRGGVRPSVDVARPDLRVHVHLAEGRCTLSLDSSGRPLHERGYRKSAGPAPLRETLAAALLELAGWDGTAPLADPMCGSGTIPIEAALRASKTAPGLLNPVFGFQRWLGFQRPLWEGLLVEARRARLDRLDAAVHASDRSPEILECARENARAALGEGFIRWTRADVLERAAPPGPAGVLLSNPPYGERLGEPAQLERFYKALGDALQERWPGWTVYLLAGNPLLAKRVWMKTSRRFELWNGPIACRLLEYEIRGPAKGRARPEGGDHAREPYR